ncbi:MAG: redoxin family protein [Verrucomicrobiales bacterium]|nr:redoxin family protein [Verrucomicrobiales bacterium]
MDFLFLQRFLHPKSPPEETSKHNREQTKRPRPVDCRRLESFRLLNYPFQMPKLPFLLTVFVTFTLLPAPAVFGDSDISLTDLHGNSVNPLKVSGKSAVVLFFISPYCPTSNTFAPYMKDISEAFEENFTFFSIHSDTSVTDQDRATHAQLMKINHPVLKDGEQLLAKKLGATTTPEVVVIDAEGKTRYQGRINDLYLGPTQKQKEPTSHDLRDALEAIIHGKPVPAPRTEATGCSISGV